MSNPNTQRPPGVPENAVEISLDQLAQLAKSDPKMQELYEKAVQARREAEHKKATEEAAKAGKPAPKPASAPKAGEQIPVIVNGSEIYQWSQTLDEVNIYVKRPPGVPAKAIGCEITANHIKLGINIKSAHPQYYFDEELGGSVSTDESFMTIEDDTIVIYLQKTKIGEGWKAALAAHAVHSELDEAQLRQQMLMDRFQRENPGFDFSRAQFSGSAPDPTEFLGGIDRNKLR